MSLSVTGKAGAAMSLLTASEDAAIQERLSKGAGVTKAEAGPQGHSKARDTADRTTFSSRFWNPDETIDFSMDAYTRNGTRVQVEAGSRGLTMGHFANKGSTENKFNLAGARAPLDMSVTFTTADGNSKTYKVNENMTFHETEEGLIVEGKSVGNKIQDPNDPTKAKAETNIVFNMDDKGAAVGGNGDDLLFNFASEAYVNGKEGDDTVINMGDKAELVGGEGEDMIKIVKDVIRDEKKSTLDIEAMDPNTPNMNYDLVPEYMVGLKGGQEVDVDGGEGNDTIDSRDAKLENATIKGSEGDDTMLLGDLVSSTVKGGEGNDLIEVEDMLQSTIDGGKGNDIIDVGRSKNSTILGSDGDDYISVDHSDGGTIDGGKGDDTIDVGIGYRTYVKGGKGDDMINIGHNVQGIVEAGEGDDIIAVNKNLGGVIDGGVGNDLIAVNSNTSREGDISYGSPVIMGGAGNDIILVGKSENGFIVGGKGDDLIAVGSSFDSLIAGGSGDDSLRTGVGSGNLVDGGSGSNDIQLNKNASVGSFKVHNLTANTIDMKALALFMKQRANDGVEPDSNTEGLTLSEDQWMELARQRVEKELTGVAGMEADVVVDNGKLVQGTADMLAGKVDYFSKLIGSTQLSREQKADMKSYFNSLSKLAQSEGSGTIFGKLVK